LTVEGSAEIRKRSVPSDVEDQIEALDADREILTRVVHDVICTDRTNQAELR
jgi:hypothetical protein